MGNIVLDYTHAMADVVGSTHGITAAELDGLAGASKSALAAVQARRTKDLRWLDLPYQSAVHEQVLDYADRMAGRCENVVVCGIGGSALGTIALQQALNSPYHNLGASGRYPRLFVLDNIDPDLVGEFLDQFDPAHCLFNVISKRSRASTSRACSRARRTWTSAARRRTCARTLRSCTPRCSG